MDMIFYGSDATPIDHKIVRRLVTGRNYRNWTFLVKSSHKPRKGHMKPHVAMGIELDVPPKSGTYVTVLYATEFRCD